MNSEKHGTQKDVEALGNNENSTQRTIVIDSGDRDSNIGEEKSIRFAMSSGDNKVLVSNNKNPVDLGNLDPATTIIILASSTVDYSRYQDTGFTVYPNQENFYNISDKWTLYEQLRRLNIPTVLTLPVSHKKIDEKRSKLVKLNDAMNGTIIKPQNTANHAVRRELEQIYVNTDEDYDKYSSGSIALESDLVLQEKLKGVAMKAFGAWPDQFFYEDETKTVKRCPPNISRLCKLLCEEFDIRFGGFDFMVKEDDFGNKIWLLMDINPPSGGRRIEPESQEKMNFAVQQNVNGLSKREKLTTKRQRLVVLIAAAGQGSRMRKITGGGPKSLLDVGNGKYPLEYNLDLAKEISHNRTHGVRVFTREEHFDQFSQFIGDDVDLIVPNPDVSERDSSYNHALASLPEDTDLVVMMAADRINIFSEETTKRLAEEIRRALEDEGMPYVIVGIKDDNSKHRYKIDPNGRIIKYVREEDSPQTGIGIKKVAFGWNVAKVPVISAKNTYQVVQAQLDNGSLGKLLIIDPEVDGKVISFDVDTPEDYEKAKSSFTN